MEKQHQLLISLLIGIFLSIYQVSAVTITYAPTQIGVNQNFNLIFSGSGFYALELNIPSAFQISSDPSGGKRTGDIYKTVTTGTLTLQLRGIQLGSYTISGQYTDGSGIKSINSKNIDVIQSNTVISCSPCPSDTPWSNCESGKQIRQVYSCSSQTNYQCQISTEEQACVGSSCDVKWVCKDSQNLAYQSSDCSLSSIQNCASGCSGGVCISQGNVIVQKEGSISFFSQIINFLRDIISFFIFWN